MCPLTPYASRLYVPVVRAGNGNVLRDGNSHKVDRKQEPVDDAEKLEGGSVKICQQDGETEGKEQACDQRHEGQPLAELMVGFSADLLQRVGVALGSLNPGCL